MNLVIYENKEDQRDHGLLSICSENQWNNELGHYSNLELKYTLRNTFISNLQFTGNAEPVRIGQSGLYVYPRYGNIRINLQFISTTITREEFNKNSIRIPKPIKKIQSRTNLNCNNCIHSLQTGQCQYTNRQIGSGCDICDKYEQIELNTLENNII